MKESFGSNARLRIRGRGLLRLIVLDVKASRREQARWSVRVWKRIVRYVNNTFPKEKDAANIVALMHEFGWSLRSLSLWGAERRALESRIIKEAQEARPQVEEILCWIARPNENAERDRRAVITISEHYGTINLELVEGHVISRSWGADHLLDSISRFIYDSLHQINENLALLPEPNPIRICAAENCTRFFVRYGKQSRCEKHRGVKASRSTAENRRYKFIRDNLRTSLPKLKRKIRSGRLVDARDGAWKEKCLVQIDTDRTKGITKRPTDYLRIG